MLTTRLSTPAVAPTTPTRTATRRNARRLPACGEAMSPAASWRTLARVSHARQSSTGKRPGQSGDGVYEGAGGSRNRGHRRYDTQEEHRGDAYAQVPARHDANGRGRVPRTVSAMPISKAALRFLQRWRWRIPSTIEASGR